MWICKKAYQKLTERCKYLEDKVKALEDDSGAAVIARLTNLAKLARIDVHTEEYQTFMQRIFMDVAGRHTPVAKAYSQSAFLKDNPEELIERMKKWQKQASVITRELEDKKQG